MGYEALLFCPDEKTARTVTQVLSELEFSVEACMEPFAAVKKLMGQHFDAVVVDCDNEQNATLLFKSARNSTSNQASLAVAVVEGQAGVAKAFRIGANLVLTKPINIEQAKGTLRVARGLLRKGEPGKPAVAAPAVAPAKPAAVKPVPPAKPAVPATLAAAMAPRPAAPAVATSPAATSEVKAAWPAPAAAAAKSVSAAQDDDLLDIGDDSVAAPAAAAPIVLASGGANPAVTTAADVRAAFHPGVTGLHGSGAASAAAPAREAQDSHVAEKPTGGSAAAANALFEKPAEAAQSASHIGAEPTFTFGGSNLPEKSSGASKKMLLGVAAAAIVVAGLYFGWSQFKGRTSEPTNPSTPTPVTSLRQPRRRSLRHRSRSRAARSRRLRQYPHPSRRAQPSRQFHSLTPYRHRPRRGRRTTPMLLRTMLHRLHRVPRSIRLPLHPRRTSLRKKRSRKRPPWWSKEARLRPHTKHLRRRTRRLPA